MIFDKVMPLENTVQKKKKSVHTHVPLNMAYEILSPSGGVCGVNNTFSFCIYFHKIFMEFGAAVQIKRQYKDCKPLEKSHQNVLMILTRNIFLCQE